MGEPQVPRRLHTTGVFALLRHPQALGNFLFLLGFSLAGGAVWAAAAFAAAFALYSQTVVPRQERWASFSFLFPFLFLVLTARQEAGTG